MTECLDEETILAFGRGGVATERRPAIERHLADCDECRALVSAVVRSSLVEPSEAAADPAMAPTTPAQGGLGSAGVVRRSKPAPDEAPVRPGEILAGKYVVERVLGAGGMGVVVAARHTQLDQRVALKFLLPTSCEAPDAVARFLREGKAAASITSEHVARVIDTGVLENGAPYLVMEYLDGADLGALTKARGPLLPSDAVEYVLQACEAIVEAHQLGIVHRDLKPANLFLARRKDGSPLVKVLDFGISKATGPSQTQLTSTSMLMGSPRYMSPEQMVSARDVDARTDVWALGVVLFELVTGRPVWQADTVQGLCALIASAPTPALRALAPHAPPLLEEVVSRCLAKSPMDRVASVADLALALEPIAPVSARTSIERILRVAGRSRSATPSAPPARSLSGAPRSAPLSTPASAPGAVSASSQGRRLVVLLAAIVGLLVVAGLVLNVVVLRARRPPAGAQGRAGASASALVATPPDPVTAAPPSASEAVATTRTDVVAPPPKQARPSRPRSTSTPSPTRSASARPPEPLPGPAPAPEPADRALTDRK